MTSGHRITDAKKTLQRYRIILAHHGYFGHPYFS